MSISDKLITVAENVSKVYESGKKAEYDAFWDAYQNNGERDNYSYAFNRWTDENFKPKYDMVATDFQYAFRYSTITDLNGILERQKVKLDVSNATTLTNMFFYADNLTTCPTIDVSKGLIKSFSVFTHAHAMVTIEKVIFPTGKVMEFSSPFHSCTALENIVIEGDIMANGLNFQWSTKLSKDSITSIINALSATATGLTITLSKTAVNNAFGINVDDPTTWGEGTEYYNLRHSKDNWTISYV